MDRLKQEWEVEKKAAIREVEARTEVMKAELENLQQLYDAQLGDNKQMKEKIVNCYHAHSCYTLMVAFASIIG